MNKNVLFSYIQFLRLLPADLLYVSSPERKTIDSDLSRVLEEIPCSHTGVGALNYSLLYVKPFRNVFYYRTERSTVLRHISRWFVRPLDTIEIHGRIGGGFRIYHNYAVIHPYTAGERFTVHQGATIGLGHAMPGHPEIQDPVFGDDVQIHTNAIVFGGIRVGSRVEIGAGAVVNKDVPDDCLVVGNPMRIIDRSGSARKAPAAER